MSVIDDLINHHLYEDDDMLEDFELFHNIRPAPRAEGVNKEWVCKECGRQHPASHKKCFWCNPTGYKK